MRRQHKRKLSPVFGGLICLILALSLTGCKEAKPTAAAETAAKATNKPAAVGASEVSTVPWDYKLEEAKVGDLIGSDMTILPNNQLLPNDDNYATGDKIWVLSYMSADMQKRSDGKNDIHLSAWAPIKSYRSQDAAQKDLDNLKLQIRTEVSLIGVYKTEYQGKYREFALLTLPSGHTIKQPVTEERYNSLKDKKQVKVLLEEVHDFADYDLAMSKFRGWAD